MIGATRLSTSHFVLFLIFFVKNEFCKMVHFVIIIPISKVFQVQNKPMGSLFTSNSNERADNNEKDTRKI